MKPLTSKSAKPAGTPPLRGFSLVELSIVLVILGLLVGGVLSGQSLIRASELRAVTTEHDRYFTAVQSFRDKYFALPGDMTNATAFWGKDNTNCSTNTGTAATPGTCNGSGDGQLQPPLALGATGEYFQFWKQLALAGLIEGTYTGIAGPLAAPDSVPGTNVPRAKMSNAAWSVFDAGNYPGDLSTYAFNYGNTFIFGALSAGTITEKPVLKPEEAWNIDTKIDDGKPGTGKILPRDDGQFGNANACTTSTSQTDYTGSYKLSNTNIVCSLKFAQQF